MKSETTPASQNRDDGRAIAPRQFEIDGSTMTGIASFYAQMNRLLMVGKPGNWPKASMR
ncbi:hypothetical protein ACFSLT_30035 [Novosphingobium resinovorum]